MSHVGLDNKHRVDGTVSTIRLPPEIKDLNDIKPHADGSYMAMMGPVWLYFHVDNDLPDTFAETKLCLNKAFRALVPESKYVGDIFVVKAIDEESDEIDSNDDTWSLSTHVSQYQVRCDQHDHHIFFSPKSDDEDDDDEDEKQDIFSLN